MLGFEDLRLRKERTHQKHTREKTKSSMELERQRNTPMRASHLVSTKSMPRVIVGPQAQPLYRLG